MAKRQSHIKLPKNNVRVSKKCEAFFASCLFGLSLMKTPEYSRAVTPQIRQAGNRLSGLAETAYASLLA